ncbi:MAG: AAA family ATPase [Clostridiales bacterium]|nr:AAA family ATPase [Clostridiales bacterium]
MSTKVFSFGDGNDSNDSTDKARSFAGIDAAVADVTGVKAPVCTYTVFDSECDQADPENPIMILKSDRLSHHTDGVFFDPAIRTSFVFGEGKNVEQADIIRIDSRFTGLLQWIGENRIRVRLSGKMQMDGTDKVYAVYKIREVESGTGTKLSAEDGFLQYVIQRLLESKTQEDALEDDDNEEDSDEMKLTSLQSMTDFLECARTTLPQNIRRWARRNLSVAKSSEVSPEEKRHAQHALSVMLNVRWKDSTFGDIDPVRAREILDEELYGMDRVKQRIIETIIQINRTHKLPAYGLLLVGPAGTGKSQIAYAVARILGLPWTSLDMSSIHDSEQLTGSSRVYANAKPGSIMEAFSLAGESNLVFIINELDKADSNTAQGNPADALLTLLDNLGFTDNYMECTIPTAGVYPIATANDRAKISEPLMTRFAVIDIPDYSPEEKKIIFLKYSLPKVLRRMGLKDNEIEVTEDAAEAVVRKFEGVPGVRELEQAAEHIAANALYRIEFEHINSVKYNSEAIEKLMQ